MSSATFTLNDQQLADFTQVFTKFIKLLKDIISDTYEYDLIDSSNEKIIKQLRERVDLYQGWFNMTDKEEMDTHYQLFQKIYNEKRENILTMATQMCEENNDSVVDTNWLKNGNISVYVSKTPKAVGLNLSPLYKLADSLLKASSQRIRSTYNKMLRDGEIEEKDKDDECEKEIDNCPATWYIHRFLVYLLHIFHISCPLSSRDDRNILKIARIVYGKTIPNESDRNSGGGGLLGALGGMLGGAGGDGEKGGVMEMVGGMFNKFVNPDTNPEMAKTFNDLKQANSMEEAVATIGGAIGNEKLTSMAQNAISTYKGNSEIPPPPTAASS